MPSDEIHMTRIPAFTPRSRPRARLLTLAAVLVAGPVQAQVPKTLTDVPLPPGAASAEHEEGEECGTSTSRIYVVRQPIEAVYPFYRQRLHVRESDVTTLLSDRSPEASVAADNRYSDAKERLKPGQTTPVFLVLSTTTYSGSAFPPGYLDQYKAGRAPFRAGEWLAQAVFNWAYQSPTGDVTELSLRLVDRLEHVVAGAHQTRICYTVYTVAGP